jgi:hypothetical protein
MGSYEEAFAEVAADDFFWTADRGEICAGVPLQDEVEVGCQLGAHVWPIGVRRSVRNIWMQQGGDVFGRHASGLGLGLGLPGGGFGYEALEEGAGGGAFVEGAFGMPLDAEDEIAADAFGRAFDGFDYAVFGAAGGDAESVAGDAYGLVVAGVHEDTLSVVRCPLSVHDVGEEGIGGDGGWVGGDDGSAGCVVDRHGREVLDQGAAAPDVEHLGSETDGEDRFAHVVGVLEEEFVDVLAGQVGGIGFGLGFGAVFLRVYVGSGAGEEDSLAVGDELGCFRRLLIQWDFYGFCAAPLDCSGVVLPGAAVVLEVGAGGDGDGDAGFGHRFEVRGSRFEERLNTDLVLMISIFWGELFVTCFVTFLRRDRSGAGRDKRITEMSCRTGPLRVGRSLLDLGRAFAWSSRWSVPGWWACTHPSEFGWGTRIRFGFEERLNGNDPDFLGINHL